MVKTISLTYFSWFTKGGVEELDSEQDDSDQSEAEVFFVTREKTCILSPRGNEISRGLYKGQILNKRKEGYGKMVYSDGTKYKGDFENDLKNGKGEQTYSNGEIYNGDWVQGKQTGSAIITYNKPDNAVYDGEITEGWLNGAGIFKSNFLIYDGEFKNNKRDGFGSRFYHDWTPEYTGKWVKGKRHGEGKKWYKDGSFYIGDFENNKRHGKGKLYFKNGDVYQSKFILYKLKLNKSKIQ